MTVAPRTKAPEFLPPAIELAMQRAESAARKAQGRRAPVRRAMIRRLDEDAVPTLAQLLRGGRGGTVRLKLLLSMLWIAGNPPHDTTFPSRAWAELLGLPDAEVNGARRVADAIRWLEAHALVEVEHRPGAPARVFLLDESGSEERYEIPGTVEADKKTGKIGEGDWYVNLEPGFWTSGWLATLSAVAIAALLVLEDLAEIKDKRSALWLSGKRRTDRYGLSEDSWIRGIKELKEHGIITVERQPISGDFEWRRYRNAYVLNPERLTTAPLFQKPGAQ